MSEASAQDSTNWRAARLIPTSGISGAEEQERRATSALLAVLTSVREFGRLLTRRIGAPAGTIEAYIEVPFEIGDRRVQPDGLIRVSRGRRQWTALVEVKTGKNKLQSRQLEDYLDVAREQQFDALLTISNEIATTMGTHPTLVDKRKLRRVELHHLSWTMILTDAVMEKVHRGVEDPDQAWILGELIRYLEHPRSGAMDLDDMGTGWTSVRNSVKSGTLRDTDQGIEEVAARFEQLIRYAGLRMGRQLGTEVQPKLSRREKADPNARVKSLVDTLCERGVLSGSLQIPGAIAALDVEVDMRAGHVATSCTVSAPGNGRPRTRVNWLVRQLIEIDGDLRLDAAFHRGRESTSELLSTVREDPDALTDGKREITRFTITHTAPMGTKRSGSGSLVESVLDAVDWHYRLVLQHLRGWIAPAPMMREEPHREPQLESNAISSQDETLDA